MRSRIAHAAVVAAMVGALFAVQGAQLSGADEGDDPVGYTIGTPIGRGFALASCSFFKIDLKTGEATQVNPVAQPVGCGDGLTFDEDGTLYAYRNRPTAGGPGVTELITIDKHTGAQHVVGPLPRVLLGAGGMTFDTAQDPIPVQRHRLALLPLEGYHSRGTRRVELRRDSCADSVGRTVSPPTASDVLASASRRLRRLSRSRPSRSSPASSAGVVSRRWWSSARRRPARRDRVLVRRLGELRGDTYSESSGSAPPRWLIALDFSRSVASVACFHLTAAAPFAVATS